MNRSGKTLRNNISKLRIKIPTGECSLEHMKYLQKKLPWNWVVCRSTTTGKCYFYNVFTEESTFDTPIAGSRKKKRQRRGTRTYMPDKLTISAC